MRTYAPWGGAVGLLLAQLCTSLAPAIAHAQERRALVESAEVRSSVAKVNTALLKDDPALKDCLPKRHLSRDAADWVCKVGALRAAAAVEKVNPEQPLPKNRGLIKRAKLVNQALEAADALGFFQPLSNPSEELPRWKVTAQAEACRAIQELYVQILEIPEGKPVSSVVESGFDKSVAPRLDRPLKEVTCACYQRTLSLGQAGFLSDREEALVRAKRQFLAAGCNLKTTGRESSLVNLKKEHTDVDLSEHGGSTKGANVDRDEAQRVADRRKAELRLCAETKDKGTAGDEKLERCACPMMMRWRFPKRETEDVLTLKVEVAPKLSAVRLDINAKGMVEHCGVDGVRGAPRRKRPDTRKIRCDLIRRAPGGAPLRGDQPAWTSGKDAAGGASACHWECPRLLEPVPRQRAWDPRAVHRIRPTTGAAQARRDPGWTSV